MGQNSGMGSSVLGAPGSQAPAKPLHVVVDWLPREDRLQKEVVRDRVVERSEVKISNPAQALLVEAMYPLLERGVRLLPAPEEEDAVVLLEDVGEDGLELKRGPSRVDSFRSEVGEGLQDDLIFEVEKAQRPVEARAFRIVDALRLSWHERATEETAAQVAQVLLQSDLVGEVQRPKQPLVLAGCRR